MNVTTHEKAVVASQKAYGYESHAYVEGYEQGANDQNEIDDTELSDALFIQHKTFLERSLAYWHNILDSQGINQVVFVDYVEKMEGRK